MSDKMRNKRYIFMEKYFVKNEMKTYLKRFFFALHTAVIQAREIFDNLLLPKQYDIGQMLYFTLDFTKKKSSEERGFSCKRFHQPRKSNKNSRRVKGIKKEKRLVLVAVVVVLVFVFFYSIIRHWFLSGWLNNLLVERTLSYREKKQTKVSSHRSKFDSCSSLDLQ